MMRSPRSTASAAAVSNTRTASIAVAPRGTSRPRPFTNTRRESLIVRMEYEAFFLRRHHRRWQMTNVGDERIEIVEVHRFDAQGLRCEPEAVSEHEVVDHHAVALCLGK